MIHSAVNNANISGDELSKDLQKISEWVKKWRMFFNPDFKKWLFLENVTNQISPNSVLIMHQFSNSQNRQKHLEMYLDKSLNFSYHIKENIFKTMKRIGIIRKLSKEILQNSVITIYKSFVRPHLGYGDIIYDQQNKKNLNHKIERIQYNATLAITGAIKGTY